MKQRTAILLVLLLVLSSAIPALASYGAVVKEQTTLFSDPELKIPVSPLGKYTAVVVSSVEADAARIYQGGRAYYIPNSCLCKPWDDIQARLLGKGLGAASVFNRYAKHDCHIYNYPGVKALSIDVEKHTAFHACWEKDGWMLVEYNGYYAYVQSEDLEK